MATTGITSTGHGEPHTDLHSELQFIVSLQAHVSSQWLAEELPTIVEYLQRGWLASFQGAAVVVSFCSVSSLLYMSSEVFLSQHYLLAWLRNFSPSLKIRATIQFGRIPRH